MRIRKSGVALGNTSLPLVVFQNPYSILSSMTQVSVGVAAVQVDAVAMGAFRQAYMILRNVSLAGQKIKIQITAGGATDGVTLFAGDTFALPNMVPVSIFAISSAANGLLDVFAITS